MDLSHTQTIKKHHIFALQSFVLKYQPKIKILSWAPALDGDAKIKSCKGKELKKHMRQSFCRVRRRKNRPRLIPNYTAQHTTKGGWGSWNNCKAK